ncbi:response regulator [bacterium]|nr:response regulator [bacterium]
MDGSLKQDGNALGVGAVLVADDEDIVRNVMVQMLKKMGYEVFAVDNGADAIDIFRDNQSRIDLVIFDLTMPRMSGVELYEQIRVINPEIKTMLTSGQDASPDIEHLREAGVSAFIHKPFSLRDMREKVRGLIGRQVESAGN